eukprot:CAMPEP_0116854026 /NCGR_PEP_ID=MMETSP0418-20121206/18326_1 /TAXON_ID=1158023 /ORGANISM="Astrosyne radiata, Strain 13vi08-1A" /LENGTH=210 /DNA_ID=CAMNT_0004486667 /DNA_START=81 /DNA_END=713 /DNA_ORIENTATION=+
MTRTLKYTKNAKVLFLETIPWCFKQCYHVIRSMKLHHWKIVTGVLLYYCLVRFLHCILDAGPFFVIVTALIAIFTIGLGDDNDYGGLSAYSVFNRGFEQILGSVDADALLEQHVGGGGMMGFMGNGNHRGEDNHHHVARRPAANNHNDDDGEQDNNNRQNQSRKSGKKSRRRNLEQRREIQRQRQAAMAAGFGAIGAGVDANNQEEIVPM